MLVCKMTAESQIQYSVFSSQTSSDKTNIKPLCIPFWISGKSCVCIITNDSILTMVRVLPSQEKKREHDPVTYFQSLSENQSCYNVYIVLWKAIKSRTLY